MRLKGSMSPPGDKSVSHRVLLMAVLARGDCRVTNLSDGADVRSSLEAVRSFGSETYWDGPVLRLRGLDGRVNESVQVDCGNSGTTIRLLMGILVGRPGTFILDGDESLRKRPMARVADPLRRMGAKVECRDGRSPVTIDGGPLTGVEYSMPVASAQVKSALLLAGVQAEGATIVREPRPSRDHTERMLERFGARISRAENGCRVERSELILPPSFHVPGDPSSAAFFVCASAILPGSEVAAEGVLLNPTRIGFVDVLRRMGADITTEQLNDDPEPWGRIIVRYGPELIGCQVPGRDIPALVDEVPILALVATQARGTTVFEDVGELRHKETDRLAAIASELNRMGADIRVEGDALVVNGPTPLAASGMLQSFGDHRMAMTLRLAALLNGDRPPIEDEACVRISYPGFNADLEGLLE